MLLAVVGGAPLHVLNVNNNVFLGRCETNSIKALRYFVSRRTFILARRQTQLQGLLHISASVKQMSQKTERKHGGEEEQGFSHPQAGSDAVCRDAVMHILSLPAGEFRNKLGLEIHN